MFTEKEELYLKAKAAYYEGTPFLTDEEFDTLEKELEAIGSSVIEIVGAFTTSTKSKFPHISKMLSLSKIKAISNSEPPKEEVEKWMKKIGYSCYIIEPKFDGNSCNLIYENGALVRALTRGDGEIGIDITHVMKHLVPAYINIHELAEIRGEVLLKKSTFLKKYSQFKNPRNLVAGILHTEELETETIKDFSFVPYEIKVHPKDEPSYYMTNTRQIFQANFFPEISMSTLIDFNSRSFDDIYQTMLEYREKHSEFQLDGFVIKVADTNLRNKLGENSHDPNWAKAIKFVCQKKITKIIDIEWNLGRTGEMYPVGILEPIDLDGTIVSRVSMHNYGYVKDNEIFPGCVVEVGKMGDIIPQITKIIGYNL